jgi:GT2 family glycosyltransferase
VDAAVIVVTYNNIKHVPALIESLRSETEDLTLRVLVADNSSTDGTLAFVRSHYSDVLAFSTGGNIGYSGGINAALLRAGGADTIVVLNPDLTVERGSLKRLRQRLLDSDAGVVVPRLQSPGESTVHSLHREPSISRALGDAILGQRVPNRPGWLAGTDRDPESYAHAHTVQWATGAALMIRRCLADKVEWDESFFLYSEETDFFRRIRSMNRSIWYEPSAVMTHTGGGSGSSAELNALLSVNRIRYIRKYHTAAYAALFQGAVAVSEALRFWKPNQRGSLVCLLDERRWPTLPGPRLDDPSPFPSGTIIIPAHNEQSVIARALAPLADLAASRQIELIVVCNGCTDNTAQIARSVPGVSVLEIDEASKPAALNAGDAAATLWPRLYMDADVQVSPSAVRKVFAALSSDGPLAARPVVHYDLHGAHPLIHSYYRTRLRLPSVRGGLWSGGVYAVSKKGHQRFRTFPDLTADDLFVDRLFSSDEKKVLDGDPVVFCPPRTIKDQLAVLRRVNRGNSEQNGSSGEYSTARATLAEVVRSIRGPLSAGNALIYVGFALAGRQGKSPSGEWERDNSSRPSPLEGATGK